MNLFRKIILIFSLVATGFIGYSQCKMFAKKYCMSKLAPFLFNGQINTVKLNEGEMAELYLTFQKDFTYRVYVCTQGNFEEVHFKIIDAESNNLLFNNKDHNFAETWDFKSKATQQICVRVYIPEPPKKSGSMTQSGCVSILVGFQE
ncbi:MAG: hypothetical protein HY958_07425 [Bacteroidia bacterium]|nr:hypothetical protein [Bacteroidia bacterium]